MSRPAIFIPKFIGAISLGLLTGLSYTLTNLTLPSLLSFPTLPPARSSFRILRTSTQLHQNIISALSVVSLLSAYAFAPRSQRQPYLLWAASTVAIASQGAELLDRWMGNISTEGTREEEVNGEAVREEMEGWRKGQMVKGGIWGLGFAMSVVGIWGDAY